MCRFFFIEQTEIFCHNIIVFSRILYFFLAFLLLTSASAGNCVQKVCFKSSDEIKIIKIHSPSQKVFVSLSESKNAERTIIRSGKKSVSIQEFSAQTLFAQAKSSFVQSFSPTKLSASYARVFLLPKSLKTIIFLQTLV